MEINLENIGKVVNTPTVRNLVSSWLMQKAMAQFLREQVDAIYLEVLTEIPIFSKDGTRILGAELMYLSDDEESCQKIYDKVEILTRERGLKPDDMRDGVCPALVAENNSRKIEHLIIAETGHPFGITVESLLMSQNGFENYRKYIDFVIGAVISLPDFKNPINNL